MRELVPDSSGDTVREKREQAAQNAPAKVGNNVNLSEISPNLPNPSERLQFSGCSVDGEHHGAGGQRSGMDGNFQRAGTAGVPVVNGGDYLGGRVGGQVDIELDGEAVLKDGGVLLRR